MPSLVIVLRVTLHLSSHALLRIRCQVHVVLVRLQQNTCLVDSARGCPSSRRAFALATEDLRRRRLCAHSNFYSPSRQHGQVGSRLRCCSVVAYLAHARRVSTMFMKGLQAVMTCVATTAFSPFFAMLGRCSTTATSYHGCRCGGVQPCPRWLSWALHSVWGSANAFKFGHLSTVSELGGLGQSFRDNVCEFWGDVPKLGWLANAFKLRGAANVFRFRRLGQRRFFGGGGGQGEPFMSRRLADASKLTDVGKQLFSRVG